MARDYTRPGLFTGKVLYTVAASTAPEAEKVVSDYVSDGTADDKQIQASLDSLPA